MSPASFLRDYWQKRPLLIRGAFAEFVSPISGDDLAGLACEELALSRIVIHDPKRDTWMLRSGPFSEADFAVLPKSHWTLLVQDVDKWDADVAALLEHFSFLPSWRIDDIMVSYAEDSGSVGAHVDQYDVFLLQAQGRRRWQIDTRANSPRDFRDEVDLKLLRKFNPNDEWLLEPGDMLYLPPGVPHHGIADGKCLTFSIGMRAPAKAELLGDLADFLAERMGEDDRYGDGDLLPAKSNGEIDEAALKRLRMALSPFAEVDASLLRRWFGQFITRYRAANLASPRARPLTASQWQRTLAEGNELLRNPWSRFAWSKARTGVTLFVAGEEFASSRQLAEKLCAHSVLAIDSLGKLSTRDDTTLLALVNGGHLVVRKIRARRVNQ